MSGLQEAFYIVGLVFMGIMLLLVAALVTAVFVIKGKINKIHETIDRKIDSVTNIAEKGGELAALASSGALKKAYKAWKKKR